VSDNIFQILATSLSRPETLQELVDPQKPLPENIPDLLEVATGHAQAQHEALPKVLQDCSHDELHDHILHFLEQVLLVEGADYYRILGLFADATQDEVNRHYQLLMQLFFSDTEAQPENWKEETAVRINRAYSVLRELDKRQAYDQKLTNNDWPMHRLGERRKVPKSSLVKRPAAPRAKSKPDAPFLANQIGRVQDAASGERRMAGHGHAKMAVSESVGVQDARSGNAASSSAVHKQHNEPFGSFLDTHFNRADSNLSDTELRRVRREPSWTDPAARSHAPAEDRTVLPDLDHLAPEPQVSEKRHRLISAVVVVVFIVVVGTVSYLLFAPVGENKLTPSVLSKTLLDNAQKLLPARDDSKTSGESLQSIQIKETSREPALVIARDEQPPAIENAIQSSTAGDNATSDEGSTLAGAVTDKESVAAATKTVSEAPKLNQIADLQASKAVSAAASTVQPSRTAAEESPTEKAAVPSGQGSTVQNSGAATDQHVVPKEAKVTESAAPAASIVSQPKIATKPNASPAAPDTASSNKGEAKTGQASGTPDVIVAMAPAASAVPSGAGQTNIQKSGSTSEAPVSGAAEKPLAIARLEARPETTPPSSPAPLARVTEQELTKVLDRFRVAYKQGDLQTLIDLFAEDARTNDQSDRTGIRKDYSDLFEMTSRRQIFFRDITWQTEPDRAEGEGKFEVWIYPNGSKNVQTIFGTLTLEFVRRNNELVIKRFIHSYE